MLILFPSSREGILYEKNIDWALFIELKIIEAIHLNFIIFISPFKTFLAILSFPFIVNNTLHPLHVCEQAFRIQFPCNLCKPAPKNPITYSPSKLYPNTSFQYFANAQSIHLLNQYPVHLLIPKITPLVSRIYKVHPLPFSNRETVALQSRFRGYPPRAHFLLLAFR